MKTIEQAIENLKTLLRIDSTEQPPQNGKPFGPGVYKCLEEALKILDEQGFNTKNGNGYYGYGEIGNGPLFGILTHLDVVPVGKGWTKEPFGATIENGKLYARGALDDKGPFIECLYAVCRLLSENYRPKYRIRFILGCNEESGWKCMEEYTKKEEMPVLGISPDGDFPVINCEKGIVYHSLRYPKPQCIEYLRAGERANMVPDFAEAKVRYTKDFEEILKKEKCEYKKENDFLVVVTHGISAHGSQPQTGESALLKMFQILSSEDTFFEKMYNMFSSPYGKGLDLDIADEKSGRLTQNLGKVCTEENDLVFELDIRHPVSYKKEFITEKLKEKTKANVTEVFFHLPLYIEKGHPLVKTLLDAYNKVTGENAQPISIGGGTYARVLPVGVAFGPCFPNSEAKIHCADEYIDLQEFKVASEIYYHALKNLCFE